MRQRSKNLEEIYKRIQTLAEPYLNTRANDVHTEIALTCAYDLLKKEGGDEDIVIPAIILHDTGWIRVPEKKQLKAFGPDANAPEITRIHEVEGVKIAMEILEKVHYDKNKTSEIFQIIDGHDSRSEALSLNDKIVKDADKLSRYNKEVLNAFLNKLQTVDFEYSLHHLRDNIEIWFFTKTAKTIARRSIRQLLGELEGARN